MPMRYRIAFPTTPPVYLRLTLKNTTKMMLEEFVRWKSTFFKNLNFAFYFSNPLLSSIFFEIVSFAAVA